MDPLTMYRLGQIRNKELVEECLRDQLFANERPHRDSLAQRLSALLHPVIARREQIIRTERGKTLAPTH